MSGERKYCYDVIRVLAMVMVLVNHTVASEIMLPQTVIGRIICVAMMLFSRMGVPLFLMLSGALILSSRDTPDFKTLFFKKILKIALPLITWSLIYFLMYNVVASDNFSFGGLFSLILRPGDAGHLWYLYVLVGLYMLIPVFFAIVHYMEGNWIPYLLIGWILFSGVMHYMGEIGVIDIPKPYMNMHILNGLWGYFLLGYYVVKKKVKPNLVFQIITVVIFALLTAGVYVNVYINGHVSFDLFSYSGLPLILMTCVVFGCLCRLNDSKNGKLKNFIGYLSRISFGVYLNQFLARALAQKLCESMMGNTLLYLSCLFVLTTIISVAGAAIVALIPRRNKLLSFVKTALGA